MWVGVDTGDMQTAREDNHATDKLTCEKKQPYYIDQVRAEALSHPSPQGGLHPEHWYISHRVVL